MKKEFVAVPLLVGALATGAAELRDEGICANPAAACQADDEHGKRDSDGPAFDLRMTAVSTAGAGRAAGVPPPFSQAALEQILAHWYRPAPMPEQLGSPHALLYSSARSA